MEPAPPDRGLIALARSLREQQHLGADSVWLAGSRIAIIASTVLVAPVLVSELGAATFGVWALVLAAAGLFGVVGSGSEMVVARVIAGLRVRGMDTRRPALVAVLLAAVESSLLTVALVLLAPAIVSGAGISGPAEADAVEAMRWVAVSYVFQRVARAAAGCLSGLDRHRARAMFEVLTPVLFAAGGIAALLLGGGLVALSVTYLLANVVGAAAAVVALRGSPGGERIELRETALTLWRLGRPRQVSQVALVVALLAERVLISQFGDEIVTGQFAAASTLVAAAAMILLYALNPLGPRLAALAASDGADAVRASAHEAARTAALLAGACLGALAACGTPLMAGWLGPELEASHFIAVLVPGFFVWLLARVGFHAAAALDEPWLEARSAALAIVVNVALALVLLATLGPEVAGVATTLALGCWAAAFARSARGLLRAPATIELLGPALLATAIAAVLASGGELLLAPDEGTRWGQLAFAAGQALAFLALYALAAGRLMRPSRTPSS